jgi:hypothetical protein
MNNWCIYWFFTHFLLGILIFKGLTARRLYKSFGIKGLSFVKLLGTPAVNLITSLLLYQSLLLNTALGPHCLFRVILLWDRWYVGLPPATLAPWSHIRNNDWPIPFHCAVCRTSPILLSSSVRQKRGLELLANCRSCWKNASALRACVCVCVVCACARTELHNY